MKKIFNTLSVMALALMVFSCERDNVSSGNIVEPSLKTSKAEIVSPADRVTASDTAEIVQEVFDTLGITSTRSWNVQVKTEDGGSWLSTSTDEHINVTGEAEVFNIQLRLSRYRGSIDRKGCLIFRCAELKDSIVVPVVQKAFVPEIRLEILGGASNAIPALSSKVSVLVRSNTSWSADIDPLQSSVQPDLSKTAGDDLGVVDLTFPDNFDDESAKLATFIVKADDCKDQVIEFVQRQSENFFYINGEFGGRLNPLDADILIPLCSNGNWTAEISDCTYKNAKLSKTSGGGTMSGVTFTADHGADPEVAEKHATVTFKRAGKENLVVSFSQEGCIHFNCGHYNPTYEKGTSTVYKPYTAFVNPFSDPATLPSSQTSLTYKDSVVVCTLKNGGYQFSIYGQTNGLWVNPGGQLLMFGMSINDYILFPALPGYRLSKMVYESSCRVASQYTIRTADGSTIIQGGESRQTTEIEPITCEHQEVMTHTFPNTAVNTRYRLNNEREGAVSIKDLCLIYEKVSE